MDMNLDYSEIITPSFCEKIGLERYYPYEARDLVVVNGESCSGHYQGPLGDIPSEIVISSKLSTPASLMRVYIHEVAHQITHETDLLHVYHGNAHNCYFAILAMVMMRRNGDISGLKIYDFNEGILGEGKSIIENDDELIDRFAFILKISSLYAPLNISVESIAKRLFQEFARSEWKTKKAVAQGFANPSSQPILKFIGGLVLGCLASSPISYFFTR